MEPISKKRRLAPKVTEKLNHDQSLDHQRIDYRPSQFQPPQDATMSMPPSENTDFERFTRQVHDVASLNQTQNNKPQYNSVSVLLLRWENDVSVEQDLLNLQALFRERYNYRTESWGIPSGSNSNIQLSKQLAEHIEKARPGHLFIIYYIGQSYVGSDQHIYWSYESREEHSRLKWDAIRFLIEDAQSDVLFLLDSCADAEPQSFGMNGVKQGIAAHGRDVPSLGVEHEQTHTFTYSLINALHRLADGPAFTVKRLHEEILAIHPPRSSGSGLTNGDSRPISTDDAAPITFMLTSNVLHSITLEPLVNPQIHSPTGSQLAAGVSNGTSNASAQHDLFDETRALVSLNFFEDPNQEMTAFKQWLNSSPATAAKVTVEASFEGPQPIIIISLPMVIFNAVVNDRIITFIGFIKSHNIARERTKFMEISSIDTQLSSKHLEDGKILLEVAAAAQSPPLPRHDPHLTSPNMGYPGSSSQGSLPHLQQPPMVDRSLTDRKDDLEDSDEMHEAAIQLKALSHMRTINHENHQDRSNSQLPPDGSPERQSAHEDSVSSGDVGDSGMDDNLYSSEYNSPASRPKGRRSIQKQGPKQDTRCSMCSHAPFKDSSSLRKHIAAAHTRPFPCAFAFAGCISTFGSKNEWKRHIASQHLCLTYYRCSSCPQSSAEGKGNEFNRKDLFTQHLRRMHAPFAIKKALAKGDSKLQLEWETHVKDMQTSCLVERRSPPMRSACPKPDCSNIFEGQGSWDDWTEHVGRHMEKGEASRLGVDRLLAMWALEEGIIERQEDGEYHLVGSDREGNSGYMSEGTKRALNEQLDESIIHDDRRYEE